MVKSWTPGYAEPHLAGCDLHGKKPGWACPNGTSCGERWLPMVCPALLRIRMVDLGNKTQMSVMNNYAQFSVFFMMMRKNDSLIHRDSPSSFWWYHVVSAKPIKCDQCGPSQTSLTGPKPKKLQWRQDSNHLPPLI